MWSAMPDFSISPYVTVLKWCCSLILRGQPVSPLYFSPQLHGMAYTQSLHVPLYRRVLLGRVVCKVLSHFWRSSWYYMDHRCFIFFLIIPSCRVSSSRWFSEFCYPLAPLYPSLLELPSYTQCFRILLILTISCSYISGLPHDFCLML